MIAVEQKLDFDAWLAELKADFVARSGMNKEQAQAYVYDNRPDWREYYDDGFEPTDAASEDMSYWD